MLTKQITINRKTGETTVKIVSATRQLLHRDPWEILVEMMIDHWLKEKDFACVKEEGKKV